ncbi:MAG: cache domain-containing protein [Deltaproteobacteria bacterium]|nr:cache domain-containing protein [Deltaproteobacteria bacterium]
MKSRLWFKVFAYIFFIVGGCTLALALCTIPLIRDITYTMEEKLAVSLLDRLESVVEAKYDEIAAYRREALAQRKQELTHLVRIALDYLATQERASRQPGADVARIKKECLDTVRGFLYAKDDYIYIADFAAKLLSHPDPRLHGADFSQVKDVKGNLIVPRLLEVVRREGEGFTTYWWNRLGRTKPSEKLTYGRLFAPWDWVVATGVYVDDIEEEVQRRQRELVDQLRLLMARTKLGRTGYMYIFDKNLKMVIHPDHSLEGQDVGQLRDPSTGKPLFPALKAQIQRPGKPLAYKWDRPGDRGHYVYDKLSWVRHSPGFNWYIASSVYQDELLEDSQRLTWRIVGISAAVFLASLLAGFYFLKKLLKPIEVLSRTAYRVREGDLSVRSGLAGDDEIGFLGSQFDSMVDTLEDHVRTLDAKVQEKTAELSENLARLAEANTEIMESIEYARTIQRALLPTEAELAERLGEYFFLYRPKEVIGGDLLWLRAEGPHFCLALLDCTGHGVPGAIMTTIAATSLRRALKEQGFNDPAAILARLNGLVRRMLSQDSDGGRSDDGLDIALCLVDQEKGELTFAGARLGLFLAQGGVVQEIRGDRQSLGYRSSGPGYQFTNHRVELTPGLRCYLATDGLWDQVGGERGLPFGRTRFLEFLASQAGCGLAGQREALEETLAAYQGDGPQRDDLTVLGFTLTPKRT